MIFVVFQLFLECFCFRYFMRFDAFQSKVFLIDSLNFASPFLLNSLHLFAHIGDFIVDLNELIIRIVERLRHKRFGHLFDVVILGYFSLKLMHFSFQLSVSVFRLFIELESVCSLGVERLVKLKRILLLLFLLRKGFFLLCQFFALSSKESKLVLLISYFDVFLIGNGGFDSFYLLLQFAHYSQLFFSFSFILLYNLLGLFDSGPLLSSRALDDIADHLLQFIYLCEELAILKHEPCAVAD